MRGGVRQFPSGTARSRPPAYPCAGADDLIGPPAGLGGSGRSSAAARSRPQCRAGDFARRLGHCGIARFPGRCKHRPLRMRGRFLASFAGYLRCRAAMHPSGCALRRIQPPVCGARIALRALKHTRVLRPPHLLRLAVSAAGGARLRSPLQGSLSKRQSPAKQAKQIQPGTRRFRAVLFCTETPVRGSLFGNH